MSTVVWFSTQCKIIQHRMIVFISPSLHDLDWNKLPYCKYSRWLCGGPRGKVTSGTSCCHWVSTPGGEDNGLWRDSSVTRVHVKWKHNFRVNLEQTTSVLSALSDFTTFLQMSTHYRTTFLVFLPFFIFITFFSLLWNGRFNKTK